MNCTKAASEEDARILVPLKPSLSNMCLAKITVGLYNEFGIKTFVVAFPEMKIFFRSEAFEKPVQGNFTHLCDRAKKRMLLIPTSLRKRTLKAVERVQDEIIQWIFRHEKQFKSLKYYGKCIFFWRSDGSIDRTKTAQETVCNQHTTVRARFEMACMYCLEKNVRTLWSELEENGESDSFDKTIEESDFNAMVPFWVRWIQEGAQIPWTQAACKYLDFKMFRIYLYGSPSSLSSLFRALKPEERCKFFENVFLCDEDDLLFSFYAVTNKEQEDLMKICARYVLLTHADGPLASILELAENSWRFLDQSAFHGLLVYLLKLKDRVDFDYYAYLAVEFWNRSPDHFKEHGETPEYCCCGDILNSIQERKGDFNNEDRVRSHKKILKRLVIL